MILIPQVSQCQNCKSLKELLEEIDCSLYNLITNRWNNEKYNTSLYFSIEHFKALSHYKRILNIRIFNPRYTKVKAQDLISQATKLLYGNMNCSKCFNCDSGTTTTTSTSTTTT